MEKVYFMKDLVQELQMREPTVRDWVNRMDGIIRIHRNDSNHRYFTDSDVRIFKKVKELREQNLGWETIRKLVEKWTSESGSKEKVSATAEVGFPIEQQAPLSELLASFTEQQRELFVFWEQEMEAKVQQMLQLHQEQIKNQYQLLLEGQTGKYQEILDDVTALREQNERLQLQIEEFEKKSSLGESRFSQFEKMMGKIYEERQLRKEASDEWAKLGFFARLGKDREQFIQEYISSQSRNS